MIDALEDVLAARWSCRAFKSEAISRGTVNRIVAAAQRVPSWNNTQPWELIVTEDSETERLRAALYAHAQNTTPTPDLEWPTEYPGILGERRRTCGWQLYGALGIQKGDREASGRQMMENFRFFGAPHLALVTTPRALGAYGALDAGGFVTGFCLAAQALGVATIAQAAVAGHAVFMRDWFDIPEDRLILCGIAFGYADKDHPANSYRTERATADDVIDWRQ